MYFKNDSKNHYALWTFLIVLLCSVFLANSTNAFVLQKNYNFQNPKVTKMNALVALTNPEKSYIVISEKVFYVSEFKIEGEDHKTELKDINGNPVKIDYFKSLDRVIVEAIELDKSGIYMALSIQEIAPID